MGHPTLDLGSKTAIVTGATSGIGLALAKGLAAAGANIVVTGRRADLAEATACAIKKTGRKALPFASDVTDRSSLQAMVDAAYAEFGSVEILVNCAGTTQRTQTVSQSEEEWNRVVDTNLNGTLRMCQLVGPRMIEQQYGRIINIASLSSLVALYEVAAYGASKAGVAALTKSLAVEWAPYGICVNAIVPGVFRTELSAPLLDDTPRGNEFLLRTPMKRFGQVDELIGATVFLASDAASFVTGHLLAVDGGFLASGVNQ